jgi:hypothetical protein
VSRGFPVSVPKEFDRGTAKSVLEFRGEYSEQGAISVARAIGLRPAAHARDPRRRSLDCAAAASAFIRAASLAITSRPNAVIA